MKQTKLRNHYLKTSKYLSLNPNDKIARESFNAFVLSLLEASRALYEEIINPSLTEDEQMYVNSLFQSTKRVKKPKKQSYDRDEDFEEEDFSYEA